MKDVRSEVVTNQPVANGVYVLRLEAPEIARHAQPGQFIHLRCTDGWDPLLRRPLSILRTGAGRTNTLPEGQIETLYDVVGRGTERFGRLRPGDWLDVLGPLGRPFDLDRSTRHLLLVAGGVGIVPLIALAEKALQEGSSVTLLAGFRTAGKASPATIVPAEVEYVVATDDGSLGQEGYVTSLIGGYLGWADRIAACGPRPMLHALARLQLPKRLPVQIAMEEHMGCAMGVCLGCVVPTRHGYQRVCRDGPVFDLREMGWR